MSISPDLLYRKSREDLLVYEDARLAGLFAALANFYISRNDQTLFGDILRAVATELAQQEYTYAYNLVNKDPKYLTPPDIKRRYADSLEVSSDYPTIYQGDRDYKSLIRGLLTAFQHGSTVAGITQVIQAYTSQPITVTELYTKLGRGYDFSDRNCLKVSVSVGNNITALNQLQTNTADLYNAISLAKPAHVGINFSTVFSEDENMSDVISGFSDYRSQSLSVLEYGALDSPAKLGYHLLDDGRYHLSSLRIRFRFTEDQTAQTFKLAPSANASSLSAVGQRVGKAFFKLISSTSYQALPFLTFKAEYIGPNSTGAYVLNPICYNDVALTTGSYLSASAWVNLTPQIKSTYLLGVDGNYYPFTGDISKAQDILAPHINTVWEIEDETLLGLLLE